MEFKFTNSAVGPTFALTARTAQEEALLKQFLALIEEGSPLTFGEHKGTASFAFPTKGIIPGIHVAYSSDDLRVNSRGIGALVATTIRPITKKGLELVEKLHAKWHVQGAMTDIGENTKRIFTRIGKNKVEILCREDGTFVKSE